MLISINAQNPISPDKQYTCNKVLNQLKKAKNILPSSPPFVDLCRTLPNHNFKIAMANPNDSDLISLDELSYDLCLGPNSKLGKDSLNALAFVLAHELAHFTHQHKVRHQFISQYQSNSATFNSIAGKLNDQEVDSPSSATTNSNIRSTKRIVSTQFRKKEIKENEAEADLDAGFTSYLAGYKTKEAGPKFLDEAYKQFDIPTEAGSYASLAERKEILRNSGLKLDTLTEVFKLANVATILSQTALASNCYNYISRIYNNKEVINNQGVQYLLAAAKLLEQKDVRFALPLQLDLNLNDAGTSLIYNPQKSTVPPIDINYNNAKDKRDKELLEYQLRRPTGPQAATNLGALSPREREIYEKNLKADFERKEILRLQLEETNQRLQQEENFENIIKYLNNAKENFDKAVSMDGFYLSPYLNKSIAFYLEYCTLKKLKYPVEELNEILMMSQSEALKAKRMINKDVIAMGKSYSDVLIQLAIVNFFQNSKKSKEYIKEAKYYNPGSKIIQPQILNSKNNTGLAEFKNYDQKGVVASNINKKKNWPTAELRNLILYFQEPWQMELRLKNRINQKESLFLYQNLGHLRNVYHLKTMDRRQQLFLIEWKPESFLSKNKEEVCTDYFSYYVDWITPDMSLTEVYDVFGKANYQIETANGSLLRFESPSTTDQKRSHGFILGVNRSGDIVDYIFYESVN